MAKKRKQRRHAKNRNHSSRALGNLPLGKLELNPEGYGFVETDEGTFYIPSNRTGNAMNGDVVEVRPRSGERDAGRRREAVVMRVHHRAVEYLVGVLEINDPLAVVIPQDPRIQHDLFVTLEECPAARDGDVVLARITSYPTRQQAATGYIVEVLGSADEPGMDIDIIIHDAGLNQDFSPQALQEASSIKLDIERALDQRGRRDLRGRDIFTIDPADAKDFDDAISLDHVEGFTRLGVHISDVSSYVAWDSSIDICARDRGCSVYLPDRVLPMLPEVLSNDICSLRPGEDRLALTCDLYYDNDTVLRKYQIQTSVICSRRRFSYDEVQDILDGGSEAHRDPYAPKLKELAGLAAKLTKARESRGALDFDIPQAKPVLDEAGEVDRIDLRCKTQATAMIEEAMIAANECVAAHLHRKEIPCAYRVHEAPSGKSLEGMLPVLKALGYDVQELGLSSPKAFQKLLDQAKERPEEELVNSMVLRSMERARYSTLPLGHFGLASKYYCHFTSPIRRYPDLMVHRLLKDDAAMEGQLDWLCVHASKMERAAEQAERDAVSLKLCEYLSKHVGEVFVGTISTVFEYGFFVRLENTAEGFVRFDPVHDEHHQFDRKLQTLMGEETGRTYRLGQCLKVRVTQVSMRDRSIDFTPVS